MSDAPKLPKGLPVESFDPGDRVYTEKDMEDFRAEGERAARAAAFREAADIVWRIHEQPVEDIVDALRARGEGGEG